jgi:hypothetical protein
MIFEIALPGQVIIRGNWPAKTHRKEVKSPVESALKGPTLNLALCFALFLTKDPAVSWLSRIRSRLQGAKS